GLFAQIDQHAVLQISLPYADWIVRIAPRRIDKVVPILWRTVKRLLHLRGMNTGPSGFDIVRGITSDALDEQFPLRIKHDGFFRFGINEHLPGLAIPFHGERVSGDSMSVLDENAVRRVETIMTDRAVQIDSVT